MPASCRTTTLLGLEGTVDGGEAFNVHVAGGDQRMRADGEDDRIVAAVAHGTAGEYQAALGVGRAHRLERDGTAAGKRP